MRDRSRTIIPKHNINLEVLLVHIMLIFILPLLIDLQLLALFCSSRPRSTLDGG